MRKKIFLALIILSLLPLASAADVAYILEDGTPLSGNILNAFYEIGLTYEVVRDSQIPSKNFSQYSALVVVEDVTNKDLIPFNKRHAIFFNRKVAEKVWGVTNTGVTSGDRYVKIQYPSHRLFQGLTIPPTGVIQVYSGGAEIHRLNTKPTYVTLLASKSDGTRTVIASSFRTISGNPVRDIFFGLPISESWNSNSELIFKNSLVWLLEDIDQDGDGFPYGEDCNDQNPLINPRANETPYDGIDQNCDGFDLLDVDGDHYCAEGFIIQSSLFQCYLDSGLFGSDCNDNNLTINKGNPNPAFNCINDPPAIISSPSYLSFFEGDLVIFNISATDPEGDSLSYKINSPRFTVIGNKYSWQTNYNDAGLYNFTINVSDYQFSVYKAIQIQIKDKNQPPISLIISPISWPEDSSTILNLSQYFYDNDKDSISFGIEKYPENNINVTFLTNEIINLSSTENFFGQDKITFYAYDGYAKTLSNEVTLSVASVNDPPLFQGAIQNLTWREDTNLEEEINLYDYFADIDSNLEFEVFGNEKIEIAINNGLVDFLPEEDFAGVEEIYFTATDREFSAKSNNLTLTLFDIGELPLLSNLTCETELIEDEHYYCTLEASDIDNDTLTFSALAIENLNCELNGTELHYYGFQDYYGVAKCSVTVSDKDGSNTRILLVNITSINDAPEILSFTPQEDTVRIIEGREKIFSIHAEDVDSDDIAILWFLDSSLKQTTQSLDSEFNFSNPVGNYLFWATVSDTESSVTRLWNVIVAPLTEFTCSEVNGNICEEDYACSSSVKSVKDTDKCCLSVCIPKFEDADSCEITDSNFEIEINKPNTNDKITLGDTIRVELKVKNELNEDQDVNVEAHLYNLDKDKSELQLDADVEIKAGKSRPVSFNMEIPEDLNLEDKYALYVKASGDICNQNYLLLDLQRPESKVGISRFDLPTSTECGEVVNAEVRVDNLGSEEQSIVISLESQDLELDEKSEIFKLEKYSGEDRETKEFSFVIADNIESGTYEVKATASYNSKKTTLVKTLDVICEEERVQGESIQPQTIQNKITLSSVKTTTKQQNKPDYSQVSLMMTLNFMLVASGTVLYLAHVKKRNGKIKNKKN